MVKTHKKYHTFQVRIIRITWYSLTHLQFHAMAWAVLVLCLTGIDLYVPFKQTLTCQYFQGAYNSLVVGSLVFLISAVGEYSSKV